MSTLAVQPLPEPAPAIPQGAGVPTPWLAQVLLDTVGRTGARLGLVWIGFVGFLAVFSPFLANSHPYVFKTADPKATGWGAMLGMSLLLAAGASLVVTIIAKARMPRGLLISCVGGMGALTVLLTIFPVDPPLLATYERYREAQAAGKVQLVVRAPIPFSPSDRLRDQFDIDRPHPWRPEARHWLGTDSFGADILSRMMHACRIAMAIGFIATGIAVVVGAIIGGLMGYFVGW